MSVSSIVTRGYGSWGGVNLLPTLGYGIGVENIATDLYTKRLTLIGSPERRLAITAAGLTRLAVVSASEERLAITGSGNG